MRRIPAYVAIGLVVIWLSGCGVGTTESPTPRAARRNTPSGANASQATRTPVVVATQTPSRTAAPTRTPLPTEDARLAELILPQAITLYLNDVVLTRWETFGETQDPADLFSGNPETLGSGLTYSKEQENPDPGLPARQQLPAGHGVLFLFNYESGARFTFTYRHNQNLDPETARLGLTFVRNSVFFSAALGNYTYTDHLVGNLNIVPGRWYYLLLAVGEDGKGIALVWDFEDPDHAARTTFIFDSPGEAWNLAKNVSEGVILIDNYGEFTFTTVK